MDAIIDCIVSGLNACPCIPAPCPASLFVFLIGTWDATRSSSSIDQGVEGTMGPSPKASAFTDSSASSMFAGKNVT